MRRLSILAVCSAWGCSTAALPQAATEPAFPPDGIYRVVFSGPKGKQSTHDDYLKIDSREKFEKFISAKASSGCKDTPLRIGDGTFTLEAQCDTPERDIRGIPVRISGHWSDHALTIVRETMLFGFKLREQYDYTWLPERNAPRPRIIIEPAPAAP
ncbi:hypothetical protein [Novosphingobium sp.]|uniref:hypothetical protein n=1 Tax=Novosphingobium sp. TaxID=1874826 RepID=UPI003BABEFC0